MLERKEENVRDYFGDVDMVWVFKLDRHLLLRQKFIKLSLMSVLIKKIRILTYLFLLLKSFLLLDGMWWNKNGLNIEHTSQLR